MYLQPFRSANTNGMQTIGHSYGSSRNDSIKLPSRSSDSSSQLDEDEYNIRLKPFWSKYQENFRERGLQLDTVGDARDPFEVGTQLPCQFGWNCDDGTLCPDPALPDRLFRGTRLQDKKRFVAKAVHAHSREHDIISALSCSILRDNSMNHAVPIMDLIMYAQDEIVFIIMEEWSSHVVPQLCCLRQFVSAVRQCLEHITFMHRHHIAHLDISLQNIVTDGKGKYAYIDYELSRCFCPSDRFNRGGVYRATEVPPECEKRLCMDPFKVDVWALGVLILRISKNTGLWIPEFMDVIAPMIKEEPADRPTASTALQAFNELVAFLGDRLGPECLDADRVN